MKITLVTGNWAKVAQAKEVLEPKGYEVDNIKMDTIEIQANSVEEVAMYSAKWASDKLEKNVVKNDTGIVIEALGGFPAAYTHYVQDTLGEDGILKLMEGIENRKAKFVQALAYCEYGKEPVVFVSETPGTISLEKQGEHGWCWDFIFIPEGKDKTLACFDDDERFKLWNDTGYSQLAEYLEQNKKLTLKNNM